tara:strand:+ start:1872 stop:2276 length:405 start_codon:yes stop_codon:yes gene_type:complete
MASNDLNQCNFIGRLGQDPESKYLASGTCVANMSLAVGWVGKEGKSGTEWIRLTAYDKLAENCASFLHKGSKIFATGRFHTRSWDDNGAKRYATDIVLDRVQFLDPKPDGQSSQGQSQSTGSAPADDFGADIPF